MELSDNCIRVLAGLLEARTGQQLSTGRRWRIETTLSSLLRERGMATLEELTARIAGGGEPALAQAAVEALLNNETFFFRDRAPFDLLVSHALPLLAERRQASRRLRLWSAGCATGQEAYSLAMLFAQDARWTGWTIDILATDVSTSAIGRARAGLFSQFEIQRGLGIREMTRWFETSADGWRAVDPLRRAIRFHVHNVIETPPEPAPFDLVLCRNLLMYLSPANRSIAFDQLASAMADDGWLMLGAGETVIGQTDRLVADGERRGLYRLAEAARPVEMPMLRTGTWGG